MSIIFRKVSHTYSPKTPFEYEALNQIDLNDFILEKDKKASIKYNHERNLEQFMLER